MGGMKKRGPSQRAPKRRERAEPEVTYDVTWWEHRVRVGLGQSGYLPSPRPGGWRGRPEGMGR